MDSASLDHPSSLSPYFPLKPYPIQQQISTKIFNALNSTQTKILIVESPTGTGKTYSLLVPTLFWLKNNKFKLKTKTKKPQTNQKIPLFLIKKNHNQIQQEHIQNQLKNYKDSLIGTLVNLKDIQKHKLQTSAKSLQKDCVFQDLDVDEIDKQANESELGHKRRINKEKVFLQREQKVNSESVPVKIIFVSRAHTQLMQATKAAQSVMAQIKEKDSEQMFALTLGSKNLLCCNSKVRELASEGESSIEEKCQYLLSKSSCPHVSNLKIKDFFGKSVSEINKITQQIKICGYYCLKNLIDCTDIIFVPYSSIVDKQIREKIGININNSIIVFDEGHNLLDFIKDSRSCQISYSEVSSFAYKASLYSGSFITIQVSLDSNVDKYGQKMKVQNKHTLQHLIFILNSILASMDKFHSQKYQSPEQNYIKLSLMELIIHLNMKEIRLHKIKNLLSLLDYDKKIAFFQPQPQLKTHHKNSIPPITVSQIHKVIDWIQKLFKLNSEDLIVLVKKQNESGLKTQNKISFKLHCLNSQELSNIVDSSRLTIVAGGTMEPLDDFQTILSKFRHQVIKVGHIIKPQQCKIKCINKLAGLQIKFNHHNLTSNESLSILKKVMLRMLQFIVSKTPNHEGVIVFIQNYRILPIIKEALKSQQFYESILFDSQSSSGQKADVFEMHSRRIGQGRRSILISVMGGKLSEGINFSDDLARKLVVFGLPYPNIKGAQIVEQMKYYDDLKLENFNGKIYYEGLCLKTINQTIGRAIRHSNDWAEIYLVDSRFEGIQGKFSEWIRRSTEVVQNMEGLTKLTDFSHK